MRIEYTGIDSVDKLYDSNMTGNLIPHSWYNRIVNDAGRPNLPAIIILAEIFYWYRPIIYQSEDDTDSIKLAKKFKEDMLQLSYSQLQEKLNLSKDQCRRAMDLLEEVELIRRHFRTIELSDGRRMNNVMYVELFAEKLMEISESCEVDPSGINPNRVCDKSDELVGFIRIDSQINPMTNTNTTTKNSNKDYLSIYHNEIGKVKSQVDFDQLIEGRRFDEGMINELVNLIAETNLSEKEHHMINGEPIPTARVRERFKRLDIDVLRMVLESIKSVSSKVSNTRAYMLTALYNAAATYETDLDMRVRHDMNVKANGTWGL